jgi:hypothetical protein
MQIPTSPDNIRDDHLHRPAHSCKHCQRIVIRREYFTEEIYRIRLLHTANEVRKAVKDGCELIAMFFGMSTPGRTLRLSKLPTMGKLPRLAIITAKSTPFPSICPTKFATLFMRNDFYMILEPRKYGDPGEYNTMLQNASHMHHRTPAMTVRVSPGM